MGEVAEGGRIDPFGALATFVLGRLKQSAVAQWWKLLFQMGFSAIVSFLLTDGGMLIAGKSELVARGWGYEVAAGALIVCFVKESSKLTKGMFVVIPDNEEVAALETQFQEVQKPK